MSKTIYSDQIKVNCPLVCDDSGCFHLVYQITNLVNGKIYIGKHTTKNPYDNYMGSGKLINRAIETHGIENFIKEILFCFSDEKMAYLKEAEIVNQDFIDDENTYNIVLGGNLNNGWIGKNHPMYGKHHSDESKRLMSKNHPDVSGKNHPMYGKHHSDESKNKIAKANTGKQGYWKGKHLTQEVKEKIAKTNTGKHHTQESKRKMSEKRGGEKNSNSKIILKIDEFGNVIKEYGYMKECCEQEEISPYLLRKAIEFNISYNGFHFAVKSKK